ncbi:MAG: bacterioferritin [Bdellovibrionales bacterium]|nr:bacterioferritin [Bdellovibrionales bacterium]
MPYAKVCDTLNEILKEELAGVVRYTHYSMMVYGYSRIPIVSWFREQANEALTHAQEAGELLTTMGEHPSLEIGHLLESHNHDIGDILRESLEMEGIALALYEKLMKLVEGKNVMLEEYARKMIFAEEMHRGEVDKMLRRPGDFASVIKGK